MNVVTDLLHRVARETSVTAADLLMAAIDRELLPSP